MDSSRSFPGIPLRAIIVLPVVALVLATVFAAGFIAMDNGRKAVGETAARLRTEIGASIEARLESFLEAPVEVCESIVLFADAGVLPHDEQRTLSLLFLSFARANPTITSVYFGNARGGIANAGRDQSGEGFYLIETDDFAPGTFRKLPVLENDSVGAEPLTVVEAFDARSRSWFSLALEAGGATVRTEPYIVFTGDDISVSTSRAIYSPYGEFLGVIACDIFLSNFSEYLAGLQAGEEVFAFITDSRGMIVAASVTGEHHFLELAADILDHGEFLPVFEGTGVSYEWREESYQVMLTPFFASTGETYYTAVIMAETDFMGFQSSYTRRATAVLVVSSIAAAILGLLVAHLTTRPIMRLHKAASESEDGETPVFQGSRVREVNQLSRAFGALTYRLNGSLEKLRRSERNKKLAISGTGAATWDWNLSTGVIEVNERWAEMMGRSLSELAPVTEEVWESVTHPEDYLKARQAIERYLAEETEWYDSDFRMRHADGQWIWVHDRGRVIERGESGEPLRMAGTHLDITQRKMAELERQKLQEQMEKTRNLESVGQLAGGVAHDLNNLLTPVIGYSELLMKKEWDAESRTALEEIAAAGKSARGLIGQLLAFGSRTQLQLETLCLNQMVEYNMQLLKRTIPENIEIRFNLCEDMLPVDLDRSRLQQVLLNLVTNARDAMPVGGRLEISTELCRFPSDDDSTDTEGNFVCLSVSDTGAGIPDDMLPRIFDPFFTTKDEMGTGLGLSTVFGIVRQLGGRIEVKSVVESGTVFVVMLPVSRGEVSLETPAYPASASHTPGSILVVEDSREARELTVSALSEMGYSVITADSGNRALEVLRGMREPPEVMLTDVIMPGVSVGELISKAREMFPGLRVIVMSGYSGEASEASASEHPFLQKPFTLSELSNMILKACSGVSAHPEQGRTSEPLS